MVKTRVILNAKEKAKRRVTIDLPNGKKNISEEVDDSYTLEYPIIAQAGHKYICRMDYSKFTQSHERLEIYFSKVKQVEKISVFRDMIAGNVHISGNRELMNNVDPRILKEISKALSPNARGLLKKLLEAAQ